MGQALALHTSTLLHLLFFAGFFFARCLMAEAYNLTVGHDGLRGDGLEELIMSVGHLKILLDGACPVCRREGEFLRWLDGGCGRLAFEDISAPGFDARRYGSTLDELMGQIHGVTAMGTMVRGMEVFRQAYAAVGWGWVLAPTGWPVLRPLSDRAYLWFARNRFRLTGRRVACDTERCDVHSR